LLDRIDLHVEVPRLPYEKIAAEQPAENSEQIKIRVEAVRSKQQERFGKAKTNSEMDIKELKEYCRLEADGQQFMKQAMQRYNFSGRSLHRILKVARTIADLAQSQTILLGHLAEAVQYRPKSE